MTICVFVGPTLTREEIATACDAICLPPVAQGDLYRAAQHRPRAIGIIDGYFAGAPSVWHKEILWALSEGIHVFGSASMGALRAAELHSFGMRGVGRIFEWFRDGVLEDDDEVAVVHGPAELGYLAASEPMVNIRATLASAETAGVVSATSRRALEDLAKSLYFPHRNWEALLESTSAVPACELAALGDWLPAGRIDQKRADGLAMLAAIKEEALSGDRFRPSFRFEWTHLWDDMISQPSMSSARQGEYGASHGKAVLDELRLEGVDAYEHVKAKALMRLLALREARHLDLAVEPQEIRATLSRMRASLGLYDRTELDLWMAKNDLDSSSLEQLVEDETRLAAVTGIWDRSLDRFLLDELRVSGRYERLAERAHHKQAILTTRRPRDEAHADTRLDAMRARLWFFAHRWGQDMPQDIERIVRRLGFEGTADFDSALRREWLYRQTEGPRTAD